jgi:hypothetical protein
LKSLTARVQNPANSPSGALLFAPVTPLVTGVSRPRFACGAWPLWNIIELVPTRLVSIALVYAADLWLALGGKFHDYSAVLNRYIKYRHKRNLRSCLIGAAILAQLHLFFVVDLHHHGRLQPFDGGKSQASADLTQWHSSPAPNPICTVCRVSQQGAVQLASATPLPSRDSLTQRVPAQQTLNFIRRLPSRLSSRAPPLS